MKPTLLLGLTTIAALFLPISGVRSSDATPAQPPGPFTSPSGPTCGPTEEAGMQPMCDCTSAEEAYQAVASVIQMNINALGIVEAGLSTQWQELDAAQRDLAHAGDDFEIQVVERCAIAALEAATVAKSVPAMRAVCAESLFVAQCKVVGLTTKEILQYIAKTEALQGAAIQIAKQTAAIVAKSKLNQPTGWIRFVPLVGSVCDAYDYSNRLFTAPQILEELQLQKQNVVALRAQIRALIRAEQAKLEAAAAERDAKCGLN